jgi:hypothetical protein
MAGRGACACQPTCDVDAGVRQNRQIERDQLERQTANDVVVTDTQHLALTIAP